MNLKVLPAAALLATIFSSCSLDLTHSSDRYSPNPVHVKQLLDQATLRGTVLSGAKLKSTGPGSGSKNALDTE